MEKDIKLTPHKHILLDAVEKICRLTNLSKTIKHRGTTEESALLRFYDEQLKGIIKRLKYTIDHILDGSDFSQNDYAPLYDTLSYFHNLHPQFRLFVALPKIPKEIFLSLEDIFPSDIYQELEPTIIYSPLYNFFEMSSLEYFQRLGILLETGVPDRIILMLPYVDFQNPLVWSILAHELGHALEAKQGIVEDYSNEFTAHSEVVIRRSKSWAREFCCDIIAIRLMGPSYFNAFVNLNFSIHPWDHSSSESHPHPYTRLIYMSKYLKKHSLHSFSSELYDNLTIKLYDLFSVQEEKLQLAIPQEELISGLEERVSDISLPDTIKKEHLNISSILTDKLEDGIPLISSYRVGT